MIKIVFGKMVEQITDTRWMKETEDGCIVEFEAMCSHGASYPMLSWEE